jgi:hypothetical protein
MFMQRFGIYAEEISVQERIARMIKELFYNAIALPIIATGYTRESLPQQIRESIRLFIIGLLEASRHMSGIKVNDRLRVTSEICPECYKPLLASFEALKNGTRQIDELIDDVMKLDTFSEINPVESLCEMQGWITARQIRESFYNLMYETIENAITNEVLTREDIEDMEAHIFTRLPALTLFETLMRSVIAKTDGILLIDNITPVNAENCPLTESFPDLIRAMLATKVTLSSLTAEQLEVVRMQVATGKELTAAQIKLKTDVCQQAITAINQMAVLISQRSVFKQKITELLNVYLGMAVPEANGSRMNYN